MNALELTGRAATHVRSFDPPGFRAQAEAGTAFMAMRAEAALDGIAMQVVSAFRDFDGQLAIWNRKFRGERPLYDRAGLVLDHASMSATERIASILSWSALPGASRHHWGTEFDVIDQAAMPIDYKIRLLPDEFSGSGVFVRLATWLNRHAERFGFFRPYDVQRGGLNPEPWHLSYAPVAQYLLPQLTPSLMHESIIDVDIEGKEFVLPLLESIHATQVCLVGSPTPVSLNYSNDIAKEKDSKPWSNA